MPIIKLAPGEARQMVLNEPETIMAMSTRSVIYGVDVSQEWLDYCPYGHSETTRLGNERAAIDRWLKTLEPSVTALAVEATNTYHELLVERAWQLGIEVYLISGYQLKCYANSLNVRMRTDEVDARLLARFLDREIKDLRPYEPRPPEHRHLMRLLKRRALLVKQIQQLRQSFAELPELRSQLRSLLSQLNRTIALIDKRTRVLARELGWNADLGRLRTIPGVGPQNALALCAAFHAGEFIHRDPFIAYLGLDVRTKDSGKHKGRRKLTKKGNPECRRLLHNAAMATIRQRGYFRRYYQTLAQRGLSKTAALVVIARKIARLAYGVLRSQSAFSAQRHLKACGAT